MISFPKTKRFSKKVNQKDIQTMSIDVVQVVLILVWLVFIVAVNLRKTIFRKIVIFGYKR